MDRVYLLVDHNTQVIDTMTLAAATIRPNCFALDHWRRQIADGAFVCKVLGPEDYEVAGHG